MYLTRGDALRFASRLPLAFISRAFGAVGLTSIRRLGALALLSNDTDLGFVAWRTTKGDAELKVAFRVD